MKIPKFSIIHPSRNRSNLAYNTFLHWTCNLSKNNHYEYILSIDEDDVELEKYLELFGKKCNIAVNEGKSSTVIAVNEGAKRSSGEIIVVISDDFLCFKNWDDSILSVVGENNDFVLKTNDGSEEIHAKWGSPTVSFDHAKWLVTLPIVGRKYYNRIGYIYNPEYVHMFADTHMTHMADLLNKKIVCDLYFKHNHYLYLEREEDETSKKVNATYDSGEKTYLKHCEEGFGLDYVDIFNLPSEAKNHILWIQERLINQDAHR